MACYAEGKQQQTTYSRHPTPTEVTITHRHHPLSGQRLEVAFGGPTKIVVHVGDGTTMRLPRAWTDADGCMAPESVDSIFSVDSVRELVHLVDAIKRRA